MRARKAQVGPSKTVPERAAAVEAPARSTTPLAAGPARLNLSGKQPSWREREAAKRDAGGAASGSESGKAVPDRSDTASPAEAVADAPKRNVFVAPALRESGGTADRWRSKEPSALSRDDRTGSRGAPERFPAGRGFDRDRDSSADTPLPRRVDKVDRDEGDSSTKALPAVRTATTDGKYKPGAFASRRVQG